MLVVLLTEEGAVRVDDVEKFEHDGEHTGEMCWACGTFEFCAERSGVNGGAHAVGVHVRRRRREDDVDAFVPQRGEVGFDCTRVRVEVLVRAELQRVHEDRHHHDRALDSFRRADQREVALVQCTHRRNQHDPSAGRPKCPGDVGDVPRR